jgi:hypothetical protein
MSSFPLHRIFRHHLFSSLFSPYLLRLLFCNDLLFADIFSILASNLAMDGWLVETSSVSHCQYGLVGVANIMVPLVLLFGQSKRIHTVLQSYSGIEATASLLLPIKSVHNATAKVGP